MWWIWLIFLFWVSSAHAVEPGSWSSWTWIGDEENSSFFPHLEVKVWIECKLIKYSEPSLPLGFHHWNSATTWGWVWTLRRSQWGEFISPCPPIFVGVWPPGDAEKGSKERSPAQELLEWIQDDQRWSSSATRKGWENWDIVLPWRQGGFGVT